MREEDEFAGPFQSLIEALQTDLEWVTAHTRHLNRRLEWQVQNQERAFLLRCRELIQAEG